MGKVLAIYGAGGLGREVLELAGLINRKYDKWEKIIFVIDGNPGAPVNGIPVYNYANATEEYGNALEFTIGIGEPAIREKIFTKLKSVGMVVATLIHPEVYMPETTLIGQGVTINMGAFISCNVTICDNVYIQPHVNIGHDCILEEGCVISAFGNVAGAVHIGKYVYLGISSCIKEKIIVGDYSIVGMASAVYKDIPKEVVAVGNPARPMKKNEERHIFKQ